jgi:predicted acyltransferase (DUF342 family)
MIPPFVFFGFLSYPILLALIIFLLLMLLPFIPAIKELLKPKDFRALFIKMDYSKNPRYFDRAFKNLLEKALKEAGDEPGLKRVQLSKTELVEVSDSKTVPDHESVNNILYVKKSFVSGEGVRLNKEVFVKESAVIGEKNILRAIACDGSITISDGTRITRWAGTDGNIMVGQGCVLGKLCSCGGLLEINKECLFKILYGNPIITYALQDGNRNPGDEAKEKEGLARPVPAEVKNIEDLAWYSSEKYFSIPPFSMIEGDIISKKNLTLKEGCITTGSLKAYGNVVLEKNVTVNGNIFAEGKIVIGANCSIMGDIFSQKYIRIAGGVCVGKEKTIKSVIGKKGIELTYNTTIFGYVLTEGTGRVL